LNARIDLTLAKGWRRDVPLVVRTAPTRVAARAEIATTQRAWTVGAYEHVEIAPRAALPRRTPFEVWRGEDVIATFATADGADTSPPRWEGLTRGGLFRGAQATPGGAVVLPGECGDPRVVLTSSRQADDRETPPDEIRYAVWIEAGPIDYGRPPRTVVAAPHVAGPHSPDAPRAFVRGPFSLILGSTEALFDDLDLPSLRPLHVGVRAVDFAGNMSPASELTVM
jgi:hypothetical protein